VPLVHQQARVLKNNLAASVVALHSGSTHDLWQAEDWAELLELHRIIVCTPAVLHNALSHGYVLMTNICLLIFDEGMYRYQEHYLILPSR
jgi:ERCC4-related helicase